MERKIELNIKFDNNFDDSLTTLETEKQRKESKILPVKRKKRFDSNSKQSCTTIIVNAMNYGC